MSYIRSVIRVSSPALRFHGVGRFSTASPLPGGGNTSLISNSLRSFCTIPASVCPRCKPNWDFHSPPLEDGPFDICSKKGVVVEDEQEQDFSGMIQEQGFSGMILRPGMVLLKRFLTEQQEEFVVEECTYLGLRRAGFQYWYPYAMLMSLGMHWDPYSREYYKYFNIIDKLHGPKKNITPSYIPPKFLHMITGAMMVAQYFTIKADEAITDMKYILPLMSPDICLVKFHTTKDRWHGLLQANDEGRKSLSRGLPVVTMSLGDSAEFLYGDSSDISKAEKVVLESGDVLIFGGPSRHIFHGVQSVIPDSSPAIGETGFLRGRLELTFKEI